MKPTCFANTNTDEQNTPDRFHPALKNNFVRMKCKNLLLLMLTNILIGTTILAQAPDKLNYQAILRDANGNVKANVPVNIVLSILQNSTTGTAVYTETHTVTTTHLGLVTLQIGGGTPTLGTFASINWAEGPYYLKISVDGTDFGTSQLVSVPYAKYAEKAGNGFSGSYADLMGRPSLATVATSGNYNDLSNKPDIFDGTWNSLTGKPTFANIATSGSYSDLVNVPANLDTDQTNDVTTTGNQSIAGVKTFTNTVKIDSLSLTKKTTKYFFDAHYFEAVGTGCSTTSESVAYVAFETTTTGTKYGYLYIPVLPYQVLGNTQKIKSLTIRYQCETAAVSITSVELVKVGVSITSIMESSEALTSTSAANYTMALTTPAAFDESALHVKCTFSFTGTGTGNAIRIYKVIITTE
jgi:hypothetical protein